MRATVAHRVLAGVVAILSLGLLSMLAIYAGLATTREALRIVTDVEGPQSAAAYEMEINVIGTGMGVLKYLDTGDPRYRDRVAKDHADFNRFLAGYEQLANSAKEKALAERVAGLYRDYHVVGEILLDIKDEQEALSKAVAENFAHMQPLLDETIQASLVERDQASVARVTTAMAMNIHIAQVGNWLGNYLRTLTPRYKVGLAAHANSLGEALARFKDLDLSEADERRTLEFETLWDETFALTERALAAKENLQEKVRRFLTLRSELDDLLDEQIQALEQHELNAAEESADQAAATVLRTAGVLLPAFVVLGFGLAVLMIRSITRPIRELGKGTEAVSAGDLSLRLPVKGQDEFAQVTARFNRMVAELESTTVSKNRLEESHHELQQINARLQKEIADRERAEEGLKALSRKLLKAQENERRRIAGELHNEIGQALSAVKVNIETLRLRPKKTSQAQRLEDAISVVDDTLQRVRSLSLDLRPSLLDDLGLVSALRWHIDQQAQRAGFSARFISDPITAELDPDVNVAGFRIVQEALTNVVRHAGAQHVTVTLQQREEELGISIRDDGAGFHVNKSRKDAVLGTSMGLLDMQERAELVGGQLEIHSTPGRGTEVLVRLPLR